MINELHNTQDHSLKLAYVPSVLEKPEVEMLDFQKDLPESFTGIIHRLASALSHKWAKYPYTPSLDSLESITQLTGYSPILYLVSSGRNLCYYHETPTLKIMVWQVSKAKIQVILEQKAELTRLISEPWADEVMAMTLTRGGTDEWGYYQPPCWTVNDPVNLRVELDVRADGSVGVVDVIVPLGTHTKSWLDPQWSDVVDSDGILQQAAQPPSDKYLEMLESLGIYPTQVWSARERERMGMFEIPNLIEFTPPEGYTIRREGDGRYWLYNSIGEQVAWLEVLDRVGKDLYQVRSNMMGKERVYYAHDNQPLVFNSGQR